MKEKLSKEKTSLSNSKSWVKIYRKFLEWEWYDDINTKILFLHLLLKANYKDKQWRGITIKRGQVLTGRLKLSKELGISEQMIRTSLAKLKSTNEITNETTSQYTIITIKNYNKYQETTSEATNEQPTSNQRATTTIERVEGVERYIPKGGIGDKPQEYGNSDITKLQKFLKEHYPIPLEGITDRRRLHNVIQVLSKRKNQDEWMDEDWRKNFNTFINLYIPGTKEGYHVKSVYKLMEKIKLWREYRGKLN